MTQNASTRDETACLQFDNAFFKFTEAIRDNSSLGLIWVAAAGTQVGAPAARTGKGGVCRRLLHNQIRCSFLLWIAEHRTRSESAPAGCHPPGAGPIRLCRAALPTAFHFILIKFTRCNVRCPLHGCYLTRPSPICQIRGFGFVSSLTFFFVQFSQCFLHFMGFSVVSFRFCPVFCTGFVHKFLTSAPPFLGPFGAVFLAWNQGQPALARWFSPAKKGLSGPVFDPRKGPKTAHFAPSSKMPKPRNPGLK